MKSIVFEQTNRVVEVNTQDRLLEALLAEQVPVKMACGGRGICATCHVFVETGMNGLTPRTKREDRTLNVIGESSPCSRLACQAKVLKDGVVVRLPSGLYMEKTEDLESLIGRRAETRILHPVDGRVLLPPGKIITRSVVERLKSVEVDLQKLINSSRDVA